MGCYISIVLNFLMQYSSDIYANILQWRVYKVLQNNSNMLYSHLIHLRYTFIMYL